MSNGANLPDEIVVDILTRLPAKSIGQFRCVSKPWQTLLSDPQFIKSHLNRNHHHHERLILISHLLSLYSVYFDESSANDEDAVAKKLHFQHPDHWVEVLGSCNGLLLVGDELNTNFLLNPLTRESKKLPYSPFRLDPHCSFIMYGLGYDSSIDDYKVVTLSYYDTDNEHEPDCADTFVDVYTLKTSSWRRIQSSPFDHAVPNLHSAVFVNGCLHWLACRTADYASVIAAFDLADEKFRDVPLPSSLDKDRAVFYNLVGLGGCLSIVVADATNVQTDVWMMMEYGVRDSWTKFKICFSYIDTMIPLCLLGDGEVLLVVDEEKLVVYNAKEETSRDLVVRGIPTTFAAWGTFVESLASPNCNNGMDG